ncbi:unnamed protein product [Rhizophagus irregularis]|uniref:PARP catalytic domain-containing protein n=3 Tax=Rhizophagus irregularis TaxID=588596 RepID=A0A2N1NDB2_9GLOM|nr:hypothetical protein RirG_230820 [Rhizophagus irregularis DAOM 197198w]PKK71824.1 hypothetical protein RhiirC2_743882 [Rhizophagus irregularis]GBC15704.2 hypothetical protein GLOIN_2v1762683 [Rhizophagus irregularis DAOM 181602=DAOM 197198]UZO07462.1 hypothetical protein OCT59_027746 [Rhizophagus irregularis]CAB4378534.1 unnamed protein product [Rhizophagus irregularis]
MATLTYLKSTDTEYTSISTQFMSGLSHARIHSIIKIDMPSDIANRHETFKSSQAALRLYHGTKHCCDITKISDFSKLCQNSGCGVCGIIRYGPRLSNGYVWFGPCSSISDGYTGARPVGIMDPSIQVLRAIFVMDVVSATGSHGAYIVPNGEAALPRFLIIYSY